MPYRRRFRGRRRRRRTRRTPWWGRWLQKSGSVQDVAYSALKGVYYLKGMVNSEVKKHDYALSAQDMVNTGTVVPLTAIAQGDTDATRDGNSIFLRSINNQGIVTYNTSGGAFQNFKIVCVMDTQQVSDTAPSWTDIFDSASPFTHLNSNTVGRFKILYSKRGCVNADFPTMKCDFNRAMRHHVRYNGANNTDYQKGQIWFAFISDQAAASEPHITTTTRVTFHDN